MEKDKKPLEFPRHFPPIPEHLDREKQEIFIRIVRKLIDKSVDVQEVDFLAISMIATAVQRIRTFKNDKQSVQFDGELWSMAMMPAKSMLLSADDLRSLIEEK